MSTPYPAFTAVLAALAVHGLAQPVVAQTAIKPGLARVEDIQLSQEGGRVSVLLKLSRQPSAATVTLSEAALAVALDGLSVYPLALTPSSGTLISAVTAGENKILLSGLAVTAATTILYRNAVLVQATLADPPARPDPSLLNVSLAAPAAAMPSIVPDSSGGLSPAPGSQLAGPPRADPSRPLPVSLTPATPTAPIALASPRIEAGKTHTASMAQAARPNGAPPGPLADVLRVAGLAPERCQEAEAELAKDAWLLPALGDQALCLLNAGRLVEGKNRLDQLAAITPQDWRVALGEAALYDQKGQKDKALSFWRAALERAPDQSARSQIEARLQPAG